MAQAAKPGCLAVLFGQKGAAAKAETNAPGSGPLTLRVRADFLSASELSFFRALELATHDRFSVFPKVNLSDLFYSPTRSLGDWNRINQKHVDFVLWDSKTLRPVLGVELDDSSHAGQRSAKRDAVKDAAFAGAGLPLLRVTARASYEAEELRTSIEAAMSDAAASAPAPSTKGATDGPPMCPKCDIPMVIRDGSRGRFYGCANYPRCRERKPVLAG